MSVLSVCARRELNRLQIRAQHVQKPIRTNFQPSMTILTVQDDVDDAGDRLARHCCDRAQKELQNSALNPRGRDLPPEKAGI